MNASPKVKFSVTDIDNVFSFDRPLLKHTMFNNFQNLSTHINHYNNNIYRPISQRQYSKTNKPFFQTLYSKPIDPFYNHYIQVLSTYFTTNIFKT